MNITIHENGTIIDDDDEFGEAEYEQMREEYSGDFLYGDGADDWHWCPTCGEPREVCFGYGQCPTGIEAKAYQERVENLLNELEEPTP